jgi:hypothetical protein
MKDVKISVVFLFDNLTQFLLNISRNVLSWVLINSNRFKHFASFLEGQQKWLFEELKLFISVDLFNDLNLSRVLLLESFEDVLEKISNDFSHFEVRLFDFHLSIESDKLAKVSVGEGFFGSEYVTDFIDFLDVSHDSHLFVKLRRLG